MTNVETIAAFFDRLAPPELAESWDNVRTPDLGRLKFFG
jgi:hypothetical protein